MAVDQEARDLINSILAEFATRWDGGTWGVPADFSVLVRQNQPPASGASQFKGEDVPVAQNSFLGRLTGDIVDRTFAEVLSDIGAAAASHTHTDFGNDVHISDGSGLVVGHSAQIDFGAIPELQVLGTTTSDSSMGFARFEDNASGPDVRFLKSRGATIGANTIVQDGDILGRFRFQGADGGDFNTTAAQISAEVDGTPGLNDIPGRLIFTTRTASGSLSEKMRLDNAGQLGIGTPTPATALDVAGVTTSDSFISDVVTGTAPLVVASTTVVANLNADLLDGNEAAAFAAASHTHPTGDVVSGTFANARIAESNVTQHEGAIDHDALANFSDLEHINHTLTMTITGTANEISSPGGAQNILASRLWIIGLADNPIIPGTARLKFPVGTTGQRPGTPVDGDVRYNTTTAKFEGRQNSAWENLVGAGGGGDTHPIADSTAIVKDPVDDTKLLRVDVGGTTTGVTGILAAIFTTAKTLTLPDATDTLVGKATTDTLTNKTLTTPTIASFANATHDHADAAGGGTLASTDLSDFTAAGTALIDDADAAAQRTTLGLGSIATATETDYLLADGSRPLSADWDAGAFGITADDFSAVKPGTAKAVSTFLILENEVNDADMDGTGTALLFRQHTSSSVAVDSARIAAIAETDWTSTASTQDSKLVFSTTLDGTLTDYMELNSTGRLYLGPAAPIIPSTYEFAVVREASGSLHQAAYVFSSASSANKVLFQLGRARGSAASPAITLSGDKIGAFAAGAYDGSVFRYPGRVSFDIDGTVSAGVVPVKIGFRTGTTGTGTERLRIDSNGKVHIVTSNLQMVATAARIEFGAGAAHYIFKDSDNLRFQGTNHYFGRNGADADLYVDGYLAVKDGITAPSTTSGRALIYVDSADGDLKVKFGDGTVKTLATDT